MSENAEPVVTTDDAAGAAAPPSGPTDEPAVVHAAPAAVIEKAPVSGALGWLNPADLSMPPAATGALVAPDLLSAVPIRKDRAWLAPLSVLGGLVLAYGAATAFWPTTSLPPVVKTTTITPQTPLDTTITWPEEGSAAVGVTGGATASSTTTTTQMASITKVITVMTVLDSLPLALGETGPEYSFVYSDHVEYWNYLRKDESALDVPVDGSLTQYQMIEGILLGSAGNYTDRLAEEIWETNADFVAAAGAWLAKAGISGINIVEPTGIDYGNTATPEALIALSEAAMQHPVVAEIAAKHEAEIPGAGLVTNTNGIITDEGVVGLKTGTLDGYNLLSAKNITVDDTTVLAHAVVLDQEDSEARDASSRALYTQIEAQLQPQIVVPKNTEVAKVTTEWGADTTIVTADDASAVLWQRQAVVASEPKLGDTLTAGAAAGNLKVTGTTGEHDVKLTLSSELAGPSYWWRLTHPLDLFGLQ